MTYAFLQLGYFHLYVHAKIKIKLKYAKIFLNLILDYDKIKRKEFNNKKQLNFYIIIQKKQRKWNINHLENMYPYCIMSQQ